MNSTVWRKDVPHIYGRGTRLSNAYTLGWDLKPAAKWFGGRDTFAYRAWQQGRAHRKASKAEGK